VERSLQAALNPGRLNPELQTRDLAVPASWCKFDRFVSNGAHQMDLI